MLGRDAVGGRLGKMGTPCASCSPRPSWPRSRASAGSARRWPGSSPRCAPAARRSTSCSPTTPRGGRSSPARSAGGSRCRAGPTPASVRIGAHATAGRVHLVTVPGIERSHPYLRPDGAGWPDNAARFLAFSRAVAAMVRADPPDVLHLHDWHTGAVLAALPAPPPTRPDAAQRRLPGRHRRRLVAPHRPAGAPLRVVGRHEPAGGGIALADRIVAVSPHHAREIVTPAGGFGLDGPLRGPWRRPRSASATGSTRRAGTRRPTRRSPRRCPPTDAACWRPAAATGPPCSSASGGATTGARWRSWSRG